MKRIIHIVPLAFGLILSSCGGKEGREEVLLPSSKTETIVGAQTSRIITDFHYSEGNLIDHISYSNQQTHYYEYNEQKRISRIRQLLVAELLQQELVFEYADGRLEKVSIIRKNLDPDYLEAIDSTIYGYHLYGYTDGRITAQLLYLNDRGITTLTSSSQFEYDDEGNILKRTLTNEITDEVVYTEELTYDKTKHPYSGLNYYFTGESYVNNVLSRSISIENEDYSYEVETNAEGYPEVIYEKKGSNNTRILNYSYLTP